MGLRPEVADLAGEAEGVLGLAWAGRATDEGAIARLATALPWEEDGCTATFGWAALAVAGRTTGLAGLRGALPRVLGPDGAPRTSPCAAARALWATALARARAIEQRIPFPADVDRALSDGARALWRIGGDTGRLPGSPGPPLPGQGPTPVAHTLRNLAVAWGLDDGPPACRDDAACRDLAGCEVPGLPEAMAREKTWALWSWRASGAAAAHARIAGQPSRLWHHAASGQVEWDLGGTVVFAGSVPAGVLALARTDGPEAHTVARGRGWEQQVLCRRSKVTVTERGTGERRWELGEGWEVEPRPEGGWIGRRGDRTMGVTVGGGWRWTLSGPSLAGAGRGEGSVSFEVW